MKKAKFLMTLAIAAMVGVFTACENTPSTPVGPGTGGNEGEGGETGEVLTVAKLLDMTVPDKYTGTDKYWVEGYIVGSYNFDADPKFQIGTEQAVNSSLLLADDPENTDTYKVVSVQLAAGYFRDQLNLVDHPENYKKKVKLYGIVEKYCGINGMVKLEKVYLDGTEVVEPELEGFFTESFAEGQGDFTIVDKQLPDGGTYVWSFAAGYGMKGSAYINKTDKAAESWLISPGINLQSVSSAKLKFEHALNYLDGDILCSVKISADETNWDDLVVPTWPSGKDWTFVPSGDIDLQNYIGKSVKIAFVYKCIDGDSPTWEVKNVVIY